MRYWPFLLFVLALPAMAGEIVLKDGKNIEWKSLTEDGNNLIVVTPEGKKLTISKDEIDKIISGPGKPPLPAGGLLTGASFTFDKKLKLTTIDLLATIDPKKDGITGTWSWGKQRSLVGAPPTESTAKCQIPGYVPPVEYDLNVVLERTEGGNGITVGLISPLGQQFEVKLDHMAGTASGFHKQGWPGKFFENKKPRVLNFMVRKDVFIFQADGKDFMTWQGDWKEVPATPGAVQKPNIFYFTAFSNGVYSISRITLTAPKEKQ